MADRESATLVRGTDRHGHFQPEPTIDADFSTEGAAFQRQVERLKRETYDKA